jgi:hypothetical protein
MFWSVCLLGLVRNVVVALPLFGRDGRNRLRLHRRLAHLSPSRGRRRIDDRPGTAAAGVPGRNPRYSDGQARTAATQADEKCIGGVLYLKEAASGSSKARD